MAVTQSSDSTASQSNNNSSGNARAMDFSSLAKTLSLNLTLKLDHSNYIYWRTQVLTAIEALDLESMINGEKQPPPKFIQVQSGDKEEQHENPSFIVWKKTDKLLMSWIFSTLTPSVLAQVNGCKTSFEMWSRIERTFAQRSMARIMQLKQQMQSLKKGTDSISEFVVKLKAINDALASAGELVSDRDIIICLLNGVGHEYDSVVTLISSQQNTMTIENAQFLFLMHEQRIELLNGPTNMNVGSPSANFVTNNFRGNSSKGSFNGTRGGYRGRNRGGNGCFGGRNNQRLHCQLCSKPRHGAWQCYRRFDQQFQGGPSQNQSQNGQSHNQSGQTYNQSYNQFAHGNQLAQGSQALYS